MKRVQLVVTGRCEELALHTSLKPLFPELEWLRPVKVESLTSAPPRAPIPSELMTTVGQLAHQLMLLADGDDECLVLGVDDLELHNEPPHVVTAVREAITRGLNHPDIANSAQRRDRIAARVQARCSFHLLLPLVEAYFFADVPALTRAGAQRVSRVDASSVDVEQFRVVDEAFTAPPDSSDKDDWRRGGAERHKHPKRYLKFLTSDPEGSWTYRESHHGKRALEGLAWPRVIEHPTFVSGVRALINDVADFAEVPRQPGEELPETSLGTQRYSRVLRNL